MTISTTAPRTSFTCDGVTTVFPVPIQAYQSSDFSVYLTAPVSAGGAETLLTLNSNYTLATNSSDTPPKWALTTHTGGGITSPYPAGYTLQVFLNPVESQPTQYVQGQSFPSAAVQQNFDRLTQMVQRLADQISRAVRAPDGDINPTMLLPATASRLAGALLTDASGNITVGIPTTQNVTLALLAPFLGLSPTAVENGQGVTVVNQAVPPHTMIGFVLPERYGAVGNGNAADLVNGALDSTAIVAAVEVAAATGCPVLLSRQYIAVPTVASTQEGMGVTVLALMQSNLHVYGVRGASITMANGQSTDAAPKNLAFFSTNQVLSNVSFHNVTFDMNGANNTISPGRLNNVVTTGASGTGATATITFAAQPFAAPVGSLIVVSGVTPTGYNTPAGGANVTASTTTSVSYANATSGAQTVAGQVNGGYNSNFNQAAILVSGTPSGLAAHIDDMLVEGCTFKNCPGSCNIVCGQSNSLGAALTFTGAPSAGAVSATLNANWANASGVYFVTFSDGELRPATFTNGAAGITWGQPLFAGVTTAATWTQALGKRWTITKCLFLNNGTDHLDFSSVYGWCDRLEIIDNVFWSDSLPHTIGLTGPSSGWELHGSDSVAARNIVYGYRNGSYIGANYSSIQRNVTVADNHFYTTDWGTIIFRLATMLEIDDVDIHDNHWYFDNYQYIGQNTYRAGVLFQGQYNQQQAKVNNVKIHDNEFNFAGTSVTSFAVRWETVVTNAGQVCSNISVRDNLIIGATEGVYLLTNAANAGGLTEVCDNQFVNLTPDALANQSRGVDVNATGGFSTLAIDGNSFTDERGSPSFAVGILLNTGTITDLSLGKNTFKGLTSATLSEIGGITITNRQGAGFGQMSTSEAAPGIASAATIAPTTAVAFVSGVTTISTITPPPWIVGGGQITLIPTGLWATNTAGNIGLASTAVVGKALTLTWDSSGHWWPSY